MRKLLYIGLLGIVAILTFGCKEKFRTENIVGLYKQGAISNDSLLTFVSDSANFEDVIAWATHNQGDKDMADYILGRAYKFGLGVERDPLKSKAYYRSAALNGNVNAMGGLGLLYVGYPGHENLDSAYYWFNEVIKSDDASGYANLVMLENIRKFNAGLPVDTALIISYLEKGTSLNEPHCTVQMASCYATGFGVKKDSRRAFNMLLLLPEDKLGSDGLFLLGQLYEMGEGTTSNFNEALRLFKKSANLKNTDAICKLGNFYQFGQGVEQNDSLAFIQYKKAADAGNPWGMRCVGACYLNGIGVKQNVENAWVWYKSAAKNGDIESIIFCEKNNVKYNRVGGKH